MSPEWRIKDSNFRKTRVLRVESVYVSLFCRVEGKIGGDVKLEVHDLR
jgi:hypothetical protein